MKKDVLKNLLDAILPNRAAPVLARVLKAHEGPGKTKYSVDVRVLKVGSLEDTDQVIGEVPLSPIWAGKKKRGVYAIPPEGQVVIVEFLCWNPAYPYVSGIWSDEYEADAFGKDKFVLTDGDGMKFVINVAEKSITIDNGQNISVVLGKEDLTVKQGDMQIVLKGGKAAVKNGSKSLFTILDTHFQNVMGMKTVGSPALHVVSPDDITKITQDKTNLALLLEA
ncbi:MAG: hypothetical protein LBH35_00375 [Treponema sp.]|jgi:hypothetical protein|nr:hypothetical protein [Treponema sp.]